MNIYYYNIIQQLRILGTKQTRNDNVAERQIIMTAVGTQFC